MCNHYGVADERTVDFDQPPVQATALTAYFEPIREFDLSFVIPLQKRWAERYSSLRQTGPRIRPSHAPPVDLSLGDSWPFPGVVQRSDELGRSLAYQQDQIGLSWQRDPAAADSEYPGYERLSAEFFSRFDEFADHTETAATPLVVQAVRVTYSNDLEDLSGMDWIAKYLNNFGPVKAARRLADDEYVGFRYNRPPIDLGNGSSFVAMLQLDAPGIGSTDLDIDVTVYLNDGVERPESDPKDIVRQLMTDAHSALVDTFLSSTDDEMQKAWGRH